MRSRLLEKVSEIRFANVSDPVEEAHALILFVFSVVSIMMCCYSTKFCVNGARDSNIKMNALKIRLQLQRNMMLNQIVQAKTMIDKRLERAANG